jgi:DNA replication regulator DPB11
MPDLANVAISITGFSGPDLLHVERLIALLGAQYYRNLTRKRTLLLTPDSKLDGPKIAKAREWTIPVVSVAWLWEVITRGEEEVSIGPWSERAVGILHFTEFMLSG